MPEKGKNSTTESSGERPEGTQKAKRQKWREKQNRKRENNRRKKKKTEDTRERGDPGSEYAERASKA